MDPIVPPDAREGAGPECHAKDVDPVRIPWLPDEDTEAYQARIARDHPDAWIAKLRDWRGQARMNRDHGNISGADYQAAIADIRQSS